MMILGIRCSRQQGLELWGQLVLHRTDTTSRYTAEQKVTWGGAHFLSIFENGCVSPTTPEDTCRFYSNLLNFLRKGNYPKSDCY